MKNINFIEMEIEVHEPGIKIQPNDSMFEKSWVIWVWSDGVAEIYTRRNPKTGKPLGKPIRLQASRLLTSVNFVNTIQSFSR